MSQLDFRVKLDLYKYYQDVRRFCWVFVDGTKIIQIAHLKEHISKLFGIKEPFHLLLNDSEYLPPNEDIRIVKENERIVVASGTGLEIGGNEETTPNVSVKSDTESRCGRLYNKEVICKEVQTIDSYVTNTQSIEPPKQKANSTVNESVSSVFMEKTVYNTVIEETEPEATMYKTIPENNSNSDMLDDSGSIGSSMPKAKRKRVRKRKHKDSKQDHQYQSNNKPMLKQNKPKIISDYIIPSGKHIHFNNSDNEDAVPENEKCEIMTTNNACSVQASYEKLSALLSLGNSSTPRTFAVNSQKKTSVVDPRQNPSPGTHTHTQTQGTPIKIREESCQQTLSNGKDETCNNKLDSIINASEGDIDKYPLTKELHEKNVIAFKMLKMGEDYTPQISKYILAEIVDCSTDPIKYNMKILRGKEEVQAPVGKFSLEEEETNATVEDTITLSHCELMEPRLLLSV